MSRSSALDRAMAIPGALAVWMVDLETGGSTGAAGPSPYPADSWAGRASAMLRASMDAVGAVDGGDVLEEMVVTGGRYLHVLRLLPCVPGSRQKAIHVALDRSRANLAMARLELKAIAERPPPDTAGDSRPENPQQRAAGEAGAPGPAPGRARPHTREVPADTARAPLPRRSPSPAAGREPPRPAVADAAARASMPGADIRPPDTGTLRRVARALRELR